MATKPQKDSFIVYRSFFDAIEPLSETDQLALLNKYSSLALIIKKLN